MRDDEVMTGRRDVLRRAAVLGGTVVWATPVVQSLSGTAWAATSGSVAAEGTKTGPKVEGTKSGPKAGGEESPPEVLGVKLPRTGSDNVAGVMATGAGLVAAGAAAVAVTRHRHRPAVAGDPPAPPGPRHRRSEDA